jgi:hypothetical protein
MRHPRNERDRDTVTRRHDRFNFAEEIRTVPKNAGGHILSDGATPERRKVNLVQTAHNVNERIEVIAPLSGEIARSKTHCA